MKKRKFEKNKYINDALTRIDKHIDKNNHQKNRFYSYILLLLIFVVLNFLNIFIIRNEKLAIINIVFDYGFIILFSLLGWFAHDAYHSSLVIYDKRFKYNNWECHLKREIKYPTLKFLIIIVFANFINAVIFSTQVIYFFEEEYKYIAEAAIVMVDLLIIPSFVKLFETIVKSNEKLRSIVNHAFVRQSVAMENLFDNCKFAKNNICLKFDDYDINSKYSIFFILSNKYSDEEKEDVKKLNNEIVSTYTELWKLYVNLLQQQNHISTKSDRKKYVKLLIYYFSIWFNFFDFHE